MGEATHMEITPYDFWCMVCTEALETEKETRNKAGKEFDEDARQLCETNFWMNLVLSTDTRPQVSDFCTSLTVQFSVMASKLIEKGLVTREQALAADPKTLTLPTEVMRNAVCASVALGSALERANPGGQVYHALYGAGNTGDEDLDVDDADEDFEVGLNDLF